MEMILRAPKLSDERRRLLAVPVHLEAPAIEPPSVLPRVDLQPEPQDAAAAPETTPFESASAAALVEELARLETERQALEAAERLAREEAAREVQRQYELEQQRLLEEEQLANERARQHAYEEGLQQGRADGHMEIQAAVAGLGAIAMSIEAARETWLADREDDLVAVAYEAVCRICGPILTTRDGVHEHVKLTLQQVRERAAVTVRLAATDIEKLQELAASGTDLWSGRRIDLVADGSLDAGGCVIETANGTLDARLRRQFEQLLELLTTARRLGQVDA